jgi:hypothetical protein
MYKTVYRLVRWNDWMGRALAKRLTPTGAVVLVCWLIAGLVGLDTNRTLAYQIFTLLTALMSCALLASKFTRLRFQARRNLPRFGTVDTPLKYQLSLYNATVRAQTGWQVVETVVDAYPSFAEFCQIAQSLRQKQPGDTWHNRRFYPRWFQYVALQQRVVLNPSDLPVLQPQRSTEVIVELLPVRRGLLQLKGVTVTCPDPLGLVKARRTVAAPQSILILPKLYQLPPITLPSLRRYQSGGVALSSAVGDSEEFRALRDYRPEDSPRKIHWKSWAKVGKPVVKESLDEYFTRHALILDTFVGATQPWLGMNELLEEAVSVAASFACEVQTQESLLDLMFIGTEAHCFTSGRGLGQTHHLLEILAAVTPTTEPSFHALTSQVLSRAAELSGCICIFLSWDKDRKNLLRHLEQLRIPTQVWLLTREGIGSVTPPLLENPLPDNVHVLRLGHIQAGLMSS